MKHEVGRGIEGTISMQKKITLAMKLHRGFACSLGMAAAIAFASTTHAVDLFVDFDSYSLGSVTTSPPAPFTAAGNPDYVTIESDTGTNLFGADGNQYLKLENDPNLPDPLGLGTREIKSENNSFSSIATVQFDFVEPENPGDVLMFDGDSISVRLFGFSEDSGTRRSLDLRFEDGVLEQRNNVVPPPGTTYDIDTAYTVWAVSNASADTLTYDGGTLASQSIDVFLAPQGQAMPSTPVFDDVEFDQPFTQNSEFDFSIIAIRTFSGTDNQTFLMDNLSVVAGAPGLVTTAPGDFDADGDVDGEDFLVWQRGATPSASDLLDWENNYGNGSLAAISAVPEPTSALLGLLVILSSLLPGLGRGYARVR